MAESYDNDYYEEKSHKKRNILICTCVCLAILLTVGLLVYFYFPRVPDVGVDKGVKVDQFTITSTTLIMNFTVLQLRNIFNVQVNINVSNQNYAAITVVSLYFDVYHHYNNNDTKIGYVKESDIVFPKRANTVKPIRVTLYSNDPLTIAPVLYEYSTTGHVTLLLSGPLKVKYILASVTVPISQTVTVSP